MIQLRQPLDDWGTIETTGYYGEPRSWGPHGGIDKGVFTGTVIRAAHDGTVVHAWHPTTYGRTAEVWNYAAGVFTRYGHGRFEDSYLTAPGAEVVAGDPIMISGNTGNSTGPHLHFEARHISTGLTFDPNPLLVTEIAAIPGFTVISPYEWISDETAMSIRHGMLAFFRSHQNPVEYFGLPISVEVAGADGFTYQVFQRQLLQWHESTGVRLANSIQELLRAMRDGTPTPMGLEPYLQEMIL